VTQLENANLRQRGKPQNKPSKKGTAQLEKKKAMQK
jgi:hypothetical protein